MIFIDTRFIFGSLAISKRDFPITPNFAFPAKSTEAVFINKAVCQLGIFMIRMGKSRSRSGSGSGTSSK